MKKIIVFGGSGGLGQKLIPFLEERYHVTSVGSKDVNITSFDEVENFFLENEFDIVLNMSGIKYDVFLNEITKEHLCDIDKMIDVNIKGNINIISNCLPKMIEKKYGRVISISSVFAEMNVPKNSIYCASKAFVDRLIGVANKENIKHGVTCNTIQLGFFDGGMCYRVEEKYQERAKEKIGLKRWGKIEELYNTINYIVDNEYVCGSSIRIDGGL
jgi:NAD(P)-dependent dehydrogenase (short-subunit alcohol dehydrogenase family)